MSQIAGTFTATGVSGAGLSRSTRFQWVVSGTFSAEVHLQRSRNGGATWETVQVITGESSGVTTLVGQYRFRCVSYSSGTVSYGLYSLDKLAIGGDGWSDLTSSFTSGKVPASSAPTWSTFVGGIDRWAFSASATNSISIDFHPNHDLLPGGSPHYFHIHYAPSGTGGGVVRWGVEWCFAQGHGVGDSFADNTDTFYLEQEVGTQNLQHMVVEASDAQAFRFIDRPDSLLCVRVFRDGSHANDTAGGVVFGLTADLHYLADRAGTPQRAPDFYMGND